MPTTFLQQNPPLNRFKYIAKTYGAKYPGAVLDTFMILADTVGIEQPRTDFGWADEWWRASERLDESGCREMAAELLPRALEELARDERMKRGRAADALWPWLARELVKARKRDDKHVPYEGPTVGGAREGNHYDNLFEMIAGKGSALALWQQQNRIDLGQWPAGDVLRELETFEVDTGDDVPQGDVVHEFDDGWAVQQLETEDQLEAEGDAMQHCVGSYGTEVESGATEIYSLRDPKGRPHVTVEFDPSLKIIKQVSGKQNAAPTPEYQERVDEFVVDALPSMDPHVKEIYNALEEQSDVEDIGSLVHEWLYAFGGDAIAWINAGFGHSPSEAEVLYDLGATPEETNSWPSVAWSWWGNHGYGGGGGVAAEEFVQLIRIATMIHEFDRESETSGAAREFAKQIDLPLEEPAEPRESEWGWEWNYSLDEQKEWEPILAEAERWAETDLDLDKVTTWYQEYFPPGVAEAWEEVGVSPMVASVLRVERVTPEQVDRAIESGRLSDRYPNELKDVDKVLRAVGVVAVNRRRAR